ncbi:MAG: hypothetical protein K2M12_04240 [Muribaculaceae bacterium]|nr:hypothetical protein [Muribaculaceae bacterium]
MSRAVSIDTGRIVDSLMAGTALGAMASAGVRPALLLADHEPGVRKAVLNCLRRVAMDMAHYLDGANFWPAEPQLLLRDDVGADTELTAAAVEQAVELQVLRMFYAAAQEDAVVRVLDGEVRGARRALVAMLQGSLPAPGRIRGSC